MNLNDLTETVEFLNLVVVGHVDHGKSTIIGRLLADTNSLPEGKLNQVKETCRRNSKPFEYAFLLDALKDEQAQGITIDVARCFFKTSKRNYMIIDAPGHIEFLKNMITGAARAEAAILVIDAYEGVKENSKRHGYLISMLGIKQIAVIVNKMDLVGYKEETYRKIVDEYSQFLSKIGVKPDIFIPVSGLYGDNLASLSTTNMSWYRNKTVLEQLDDFNNSGCQDERPFRMPVQGVYKFTAEGDDRRIVAGTIEEGNLSIGDKIVFYPSGKKTTVKSIEIFNSPFTHTLSAGFACGFTMCDQVYITRGELAVKEEELKPETTTMMNVSLFWLGKDPLVMNKKYFLKLGTSKVGVIVEEINRVLNAADLKFSQKDKVDKNEVAECILKLHKPIAFDLYQNIDKTGRFVIVDKYEISGGGVINYALKDGQEWIRDKVIRRNYKWEKSSICSEKRAKTYKQNSVLILITGPQYSGKKYFAKELEKELFEEGKFVYFLGISNVLYGIDADIKVENSLENKEEQLRRMAETIYLMLDAGLIIVATARDLTEEDMDIIRTVIPEDKIRLINLSPFSDSSSIQADLTISIIDINHSIEMVKKMI